MRKRQRIPVWRKDQKLVRLSDYLAADEPAAFPVIAGTHWGENLVYVRNVPRKIRICHNYGPKPGFADWEYTDSREKAMPLSRYWWRRFRADRRRCGQSAYWWEV